MAILRHASFMRQLVGSALLAVCATAAAAEPLEYAVKAAYLTKFGIYVEWPGLAPGAPLNLCIAGADPFGKALALFVTGTGDTSIAA